MASNHPALLNLLIFKVSEYVGYAGGTVRRRAHRATVRCSYLTLGNEVEVIAFDNIGSLSKIKKSRFIDLKIRRLFFLWQDFRLKSRYP